MQAIIGTGQLGMAIMEELLKCKPKEEILLVNRTGTLKQQLPGNVQLMSADARNRHEMEFVVREVEVIYSCTDVPYEMWGEFYPAAAAALAYALEKTNARLVFADNMYSYGNVAGTLMKETMPHEAMTRKGKIRANVIHKLLYSGNDFNKRVAIVKAADFVGPGIHKGMLSSDLLSRLYNGKPIMLFGNPILPHTYTYIRDFACAMANVGTSTDAFGQIWHVANAPAISTREWIALFEQKSGKKAIVWYMPKLLVRAAGLFNKTIRELYELAYQFEYPYLVDHSKYTSRFGENFTSHETIVTNTVEWYKSETSS